IVVLSMHDGEPYVSEALRRGACGYVTKGVAPEELVEGLREVMAGNEFLSSDLVARRASRSAEELDPLHRLTARERCSGSSSSALHRLTAREREVFLLLAEGRTPKQTAAELGIGQK